MPDKIRAEIGQSKPLASREEEAFLNVVRTADGLLRGLDLLLKRFGLTGTQYNVLRILRGAGERGATCREIGARLISAEPDVTRLLDRMEKQGLIRRRRDKRDRRYVTTWITEPGLKTLTELDTPVEKLHVEQFASLTRPELEQIIAALEKLRD